jgi:hypothetical protein
MDEVKTIQVECMLAGWSETHTGGVKITFWLQDDEDLEPFRLLTVKKGKTAGQRFYAALALIEDDETMATTTKHHASSDAHLMVTSDMFLAYVRANVPSRLPWDKERAKRWAKNQISIDSLSELDQDPLKLKRFRDIVQRPYADWQEQHGGFNSRDDGTALSDHAPGEGDDPAAD